MKGIRSLKAGEVFPASPTLLNYINLDEEIKKEYHTQRRKLLAKKNGTAPVYDERLRPYQNQDVHFLISLKKGKGVFNQQRVGKTPVTLVTMRELNQQNNLIIVPRSTIFQWRKEFTKWHGGDLLYIKRWWSKARRMEEYENLRGRKGTLVLNYAKIRIDLDVIISVLSPFDAVVLDEAHILRNYRGASSREKTITTKNGIKTVKKYKSPQVANAIMRVRKHAKDAYALTGTPTSNKVEDVFGIFAFLHQDLFTSFWNFANYYLKQIPFKMWDNINKRENVTYQLDGFLNAEKERELLEYIETFSIQRKRKDVMKWIPAVDYETVELELSTKMKKWHKELKEFYETEEVVCENDLTVMLRLRQLTTCPRSIGLDEIGPKFLYIMEHIQDYPEKPIIITGFFTASLKILKDFLEENGVVDIRTMFGGMAPSSIAAVNEAYLNKEFKILIGNIDVIKEGLDLSVAEEIIIVDPSLIQAHNEQVADRMIPPTPEQAITKDGQLVKKLIVNKSIDTYLSLQLAKKKSQIEIINDYTKTLNKKRR